MKVYTVNIFVLLFLYAYLSTAWNIIGGMAGQMSFGNAFFFGMGAYASSILLLEFSVTPWIGFIIGGVLTTLAGLFLGYLCFRYGMTGFYFGLMTIVFVEVTRQVTLNVDWLGASRGLYIPFQENNIALMQFSDKYPYLYIILLMYLAALLLTLWISRSHLGYYFIAIREGQNAAAALGVDTFKYKMIAIGITAFLTSLGGSFFALFTTFIDPYVVFNFTLSIEIVVFAVAGGKGRVFGPLAGAALLIPLGEILRARFGAEAPGIHLLFYGLLLMLVIRFMPDGILQWLNEMIGKITRLWSNRRHGTVPSERST
jgi:branched-chain amino acid transport system permease protein